MPNCGVNLYFQCKGCNKVRKTMIQSESKLTICGSCGYRQIVTRDDRIVGYNSNANGNPYTERKCDSKGKFIKS